MFLKNSMFYSKWTYCIITVLIIFLLVFNGTTAYATSLSPEILEQLKQSGELESYIESVKDARSRGMNQPAPSIALAEKVPGQAFSKSPDAVDTANVLVILVDFSDNPASGGGYAATKGDFDNLLFSKNEYDDSYSMTEFYLENSYGNFFIKGFVVGWYRMPETYAYYVDGQKGFGDYPQNAQRMAEDAILAADTDVDYSLFDSDGNGWCDGVFVVHAGPGYEATGNVNQVHSHAWSTSYTMHMDGINVSSYTMEPEESGGSGLTTMGVYAHEYGHFLGLPDLYDIDYSSSGVGDWSLMSGGSWNYGGRYPSFLDIWCKKEVGFLTLTNITTNMQDVAISDVYYEPVAYRLWKDGIVGAQYFLIGNRSEGINDKGLPAEGLVICHVDENQSDNTVDWHRLVTFEQPDGNYELEYGSSSGNSGDVWPYNGLNHFDDLTEPNSSEYIVMENPSGPLRGVSTKTAVWNISEPDSIVYVSFDINYSRPSFQIQNYSFSDEIFGNNNGQAEEGETITFEFTLANAWATASNVTGTMTADNLSISFDIPNVNVGTITGEGGTGGNSATVDPIKFTIPADFAVCIDSFYLEVTSDISFQVDTFGLALNIGIPKVLVVDDDDGDNYEEYITNELYAKSMPFEVWDKFVSGSPTSTDLNNYETVIWLVGDARSNILSASDITALEGFMDNGGNLFMTGQSIIGQLDSSDPTFLANYLRAQYDQTIFYPAHTGQAGSPIGDGMKLIFSPQHNQTEMQTMSTTNGSVADFLISPGGVSGLSYNGTYKLFLMSFGFESISNDNTAQNYATRGELFGKIMTFFNGGVLSLNPLIDNIALENEIAVTNITNHTPTFAWSVSDTTGGSIVEYEVKVGTGNLCSNSDNQWYPAPFAGSDTSIVYAGLPLSDGGDYVFQVRVSNGTTWSDWTEQPFHMNTKPVMGDPLQPINDELVATATPSLGVLNGYDIENDNLTYNFEVYSDASLTSLVTSQAGVTGGSSSIFWMVDVALNEDMQYFWRSNLSDSYEYSDYASTQSFWVNAVNQLPLAFDLVLPADGDTVLTEYPQLIWNSSSDNDPNDVVLYTLWVSDDPAFGTYDEYISLNDTVFNYPSALEFDLIKYWKVKAVDLSSGETWSTSSFAFHTESSGCCIGNRGNANNDPADDIGISDLIFVVDYLFSGGLTPVCIEEANFNGDSSEDIGISDITYMVDYLFNGGPAPEACN